MINKWRSDREQWRRALADIRLQLRDDPQVMVAATVTTYAQPSDNSQVLVAAPVTPLSSGSQAIQLSPESKIRLSTPQSQSKVEPKSQFKAESQSQLKAEPQSQRNVAPQSLLKADSPSQSKVQHSTHQSQGKVQHPSPQPQSSGEPQPEWDREVVYDCIRRLSTQLAEATKNNEVMVCLKKDVWYFEEGVVVL